MTITPGVPPVILVAGPPGSGKSTLGRALAPELGAALLDLDVVTNPLLEALQRHGVFGGRHWNDPALRSTIRPARYAALRDAIAAQTVPVVAVAPWSAELAGGEAWSALADACGAEPAVVWLRADAELLAARRARRGSDRDAHIVDLGSVPAVSHVAVDAALPVVTQAELAIAALGLDSDASR